MVEEYRKHIRNKRTDINGTWCGQDIPLEFMFEDANKFIPEKKADEKEPSPEEKLSIFILMYMKIIYIIDTKLDADLASIFSKEITHPSPFLTEMVEKHIAVSCDALQKILREILGKKAPYEIIRQCEDSIMGQIYYQQFAWPLIIRTYPDQPLPHTQIDKNARHIFLFTLGGLETIKKQYL